MGRRRKNNRNNNRNNNKTRDVEVLADRVVIRADQLVVLGSEVNRNLNDDRVRGIFDRNDRNNRNRRNGNVAGEFNRNRRNNRDAAGDRDRKKRRCNIGCGCSEDRYDSNYGNVGGAEYGKHCGRCTGRGSNRDSYDVGGSQDPYNNNCRRRSWENFWF